MTTQSRVERPWGHYQIIYQDNTTWTKALTIYSGESLSLHYHEFRRETWYPLQSGLRAVINGSPTIDLHPGTVYSVQENVLHRLINTTDHNIDLIEVATGAVDETDIIRIYDPHRS